MSQTPQRPDAPSVLSSDAVVWERVLVHVVQGLSVELVRAAADSAAQPWRLQVPPDDPQAPRLAALLRTLLRARAPRPDDPGVHTLRLGTLRIAGDTARVEVQVDETRRCPGSTATTGWGRVETVVVVRFAPRGVWGPAFAGPIIVGDRVGCP